MDLCNITKYSLYLLCNITNLDNFYKKSKYSLYLLCNDFKFIK
jgi:hypothetical protein